MINGNGLASQNAVLLTRALTVALSSCPELFEIEESGLCFYGELIPEELHSVLTAHTSWHKVEQQLRGDLAGRRGYLADKEKALAKLLKAA